MVVALGVGAGLLVGLVAVLAVARWWAARAVALDLGDLEGPPLPEGHRPPAGLAPISPSERALAAEVTRGLRDLQLYLLDAA